jgi:predicted nucleic acid-binding protein
MIILDTNIISELMKGNKCAENVYNWIAQENVNNLQQFPYL